MFSTDRNALRQVFFDAWDKHQQRVALTPLEAQLIDVMLVHPEYHAILNNRERFHAEEFPEANPFLHMSLHLAIREQVHTNRPAGIKAIYTALCQKSADSLSAEHSMMDCLSQILWNAQQQNTLPDEQWYLEALRKL